MKQLSQTASQRRVLRRRLPPDCLLQGQLHPNIKQRLERIRQIPHFGVATLVGVQRDASGDVWIVWEFIEGEPFVEFASDRRRSTREIALLMRELTLQVEAFHSAGLVHGAITGHSLVVDRDGKIRLTDVSPLLFHDPLIDEAAVRAILREVVSRRDQTDSGLGQLVIRAEEEQWSLRVIRTNLASLIESPDELPEPGPAPRSLRRVRVGALAAALVVALTGAAVTVVLYNRIINAQPKLLTPPVLDAPR